MADNINEEPLNDPKIPPSENLSTGIISTNEAHTAITNQETENMEVHHHPDVHHKPKKWKEYFLEFLMIFLAVTMGFFAESLRANIDDHKKEKEMIVAIKKDLKEDTAHLNALIDSYVPAYHSWVDSSHKYIDSLPLMGNEKRISKALFNATVWMTYAPPEIALSILNSSNNFNLIENEKAKNGILKYSIVINRYIKYSEFLTAVEHSVDTSLTSLISRDIMRIFLDKVSRHNSFLTDADIPANILFKTYEKNRFIIYVNKLDQVDFEIHDIYGFYQEILKEDIKLLKALNEEYHLENE